MPINDTFVIAFEGPDKVGKQTQSQLLFKALKEKFSTLDVKPQIELFEVPVQDKVGYEQIYKMLKKKDSEDEGLAIKYPEAFQAFQVSNRLALQDELENEADRWKCDFQSGSRYRVPKIVIFDRWTLSSLAYGLASGLEKDFILALNEELWNPDVWLLFVNESFKRPEKKDDAYESASSFQNKVRQNYLQWAEDEMNTQTRHVFSSPDSIENTHNKVMNIVEKYIEDYLGSR